MPRRSEAGKKRSRTAAQRLGTDAEVERGVTWVAAAGDWHDLRSLVRMGKECRTSDLSVPPEPDLRSRRSRRWSVYSDGKLGNDYPPLVQANVPGNREVGHAGSSADRVVPPPAHERSGTGPGLAG